MFAVPISIALLSIVILVIGVRVVSKLDDLAAAVTALNDSVTTEIAAIVAALERANTDDDPAIQAVIDSLGALKTRVDDETAALAPPAP